MFERFTNDARRVIVIAQEEARQFGHDHVGTEHTLLGLLEPAGAPVARALAAYRVDSDHVRAEITRRAGAHPAGAAAAAAEQEDAEALKAIGIDLDEVRKAIEANFGAGSLRLPRDHAPKRRGPFARFGGHIPFDNRNKKVLELTLREALGLRQRFIAPEHMMLGLLREGQGRAALILRDQGVDFGRLREQMTEALRERAA